MKRDSEKQSGNTMKKTADNPEPVQAKPDPEKRKRGRPAGRKNNPKREDRTVNPESGENTKYISHDMKLYRLPAVDINNPEQVQSRINDYFDLCATDDIKPSIASLALAFHMSRYVLFDTMNERNGRIKNPEALRTLKTAYDMINSYYEHMMNNGRINPVSGIFLMKNNMGYKDTTDYIITPNNNNPASLPDITGRAGLLEEG